MSLRVLLVGGLVLVVKLLTTTAPSSGTNILMILGSMMLVGVVAGDMAERVSLPRVSGYLAAGVILGPYALEIAHSASLPPLRLFADIALGLIALTAGGEITLEGMKRGWKTVAAVSISHATAVPIISGAAAWFLLGAHMDPNLRAATAVLFATVAVASSPATTVAVVAETKAKGPFVERVMATTVSKDMVLLVLFAVASIILERLLGESGKAFHLSELAQGMALSVLAGLISGAVLGLYLSTVKKQAGLVVLAFSTVAANISGGTHLEPLLLLMAAGIAARNLYPQVSHRFLEGLEQASVPVYVIFFALVGAELRLDIVTQMAGVATMLALARCAALIVSTAAASKLVSDDANVGKWGWAGFVAQAGLSLGLAARISAKGGDAQAVAALVIAVVVINQVVGPILWRKAIKATGSAH